MRKGLSEDVLVKLGQRKVIEEFRVSLEIFLYAPRYMLITYISCVNIKGFTVMHTTPIGSVAPLLEQQICHLKIVSLNPAKVSTHG